MTVFLHECKRGRISLLIWTVAISSMLGICILIYPEMKSEMGNIGDLFADMGNFSEAFGLDQLNFGEFIGFFGVECGNVLGLGGAMYAALLGVTALSKEEKEHTAEFLLTHPLSRGGIAAQKLLAVAAQVLLMNLAVVLVTVICVLLIREEGNARLLALFFLAHILMQLEVACLTFGLSALGKRAGYGVGIGLSVSLYFLNLLSNLVEEAAFLKYVTPFAFTESADILAEGALNGGLIAIGLLLSALSLLFAFLKYTKKDIT